VHVVVALVIIGREIAISALREWMAMIGANRSVAVHMLGKLKTATQMVAIPLLLWHGPYSLLGLSVQQWGDVLIWLATLLTLWSMFYYLRKAIPVIQEQQRSGQSK